MKDHHDQHRDDNTEDDGSGMYTTSMATGLHADRHVWSQGFSWDELAEAVRTMDGHRLLTFQDMVLLRKSEDLNHGDIRRVVVAAQTLCMVRQHGFSPQQFPASDVVVNSDLHVWRHAQRFILGNRVGALQDHQIEPCKEWIRCNLVGNLLRTLPTPCAVAMPW